MIKSLLLIAITIGASNALAATGTAKAKLKVIAALNIEKVSDLIFSEAQPGAASETIAPDVTDTPSNASFNVTGEANRMIAIALPADGVVSMKKDGVGGSPDAEVAVNQFVSNDPAQIDISGQVPLYVGATRDTLSLTQEAGDYEGDFEVTVVYQ